MVNFLSSEWSYKFVKDFPPFLAYQFPWLFRQNPQPGTKTKTRRQWGCQISSSSVPDLSHLSCHCMLNHCAQFCHWGQDTWGLEGLLGWVSIIISSQICSPTAEKQVIYIVQCFHKLLVASMKLSEALRYFQAPHHNYTHFAWYGTMPSLEGTVQTPKLFE